MSIVINRNHTVHVKLDNFTYDEKTDTIVVKNEKEFSQELQLGAGDTQPKSRSKKIKELRKKTLDKIKEELKPKQRERCNSVRKRSEEEEEEDENKPPKSQKQSLSPKKVSASGGKLSPTKTIWNGITIKQTDIMNLMKINKPRESKIPGPNKTKN